MNSAAEPARPTPSAVSIVVIACVFGAAVGLRLAGLSRHTWLDEESTLQWIGVPGWKQWVSGVLVDQQPPAYPLLLTVWSVVSTEVWWLRLFSVLCGSATVFVGMLWASQVSWPAAALTGTVLGGSSFLLRYSVELRSYPLLAFATTWACFEAWNAGVASPHDSRSTTRMLLALLLACTTHFAAVILVPATMALLLVAAPDRRRSRVPWAGYAFVCAVWALVLLVEGRALPRLVSGWWMPSLTAQLAWSIFGELAGLNRPGGTGMSAGVSVALAAVVVGFVVLFAAAERRRAWTAPLAGAVVYAVGLAVLSLGFRSVWWPRTLLPALILLGVSAGIAAVHVRPRVLRACAAIALVTVSLASAARWVGGEARASLESWDAMAREIAAAPPGPLLAVPDYASWPLAAALPPERARWVSAVRLSSMPNADALRSLTPVDGDVTVVARVDLTLASQLDILESLMRSLRETQDWQVRHGLQVVLLTSPDVSLVSSLAETQRSVESMLAQVFGGPSRRRVAPGLVMLTYVPIH